MPLGFFNLKAVGVILVPIRKSIAFLGLRHENSYTALCAHKLKTCHVCGKIFVVANFVLRVAKDFRYISRHCNIYLFHVATPQP